MSGDSGGESIEPGSRRYLTVVLAAWMARSIRERRPVTVQIDPYYAQWAPGGPGLQVEVVSDEFLPEAA